MFDFKKLEAFCKVCEHKSFSRAGEALFLSQPTISAHVQALEREAGVKLLDRMGRKVLPTPAGEALYRRGIRAFAELESAKNEISRLMGDVAGELALGASTIPAFFLLPDIVAGFSQRYPQVGFRLMVGDSANIIRNVLDGSTMLAIVGAFEEHSELEFTPLVDDKLLVVAAPGLKAIKQSASVHVLGKALAWPWIMREEGSGTRKAFEDAMRAAGFRAASLNCVLEVDSAQAALQYALSGFGVTVASRLMAQKHLERGELEELAIDALELRRKFYLVHNIRRDMIPAAARFASFASAFVARAHGKIDEFGEDCEQA